MEALQTIAAFDQWLATALPDRSNWTKSTLDQGTALAKSRRSALKALIPVDPEAALSHAATNAVRAALPAAITAELEKPIDAFGEFEVDAICDERAPRLVRWTTIGTQRYATYTFGQRLDTLTKNHLAIHGIAVDDVLALSDKPYRPLDQASTTAAAPVDHPIVVAIGDSTKVFESAQDLAGWADTATAAETVPNPNALMADGTTHPVTEGWTTGTKTVLWIRVEFSDDPGSPATDDQIKKAMASANALYQDVSHGTCSLAATIIPDRFILAATKASYEADPNSYGTLRNTAVQLARSYDQTSGGNGRYNPDNYDRYIVVFKQVSAYTWAGLGTVGAKGVSLNGGVSGALTAHELGHNHGLRHSHAWAPNAGSAIGTGTHVEYGDAFDVMGAGQSGEYGGHFNVVQKNTLGYLDSTAIQTVTSSGTYRLYRHDDIHASGVQALKIASAWSTTNYWVEYRHAAPFPYFVTPYAGAAQLPRLQNGIVVHWDKGPSFTSGSGTYLLDMTPTTTSGLAAPTDYSGILRFMDDSALALGETFNEPNVSFRVTPIAVGGTSPNEWIDVYVSFGELATNHSPTVAASVTTTNPMARNDVTLTASGTDSDGDTVYYHWDFGDGTIGTTTATVTHRWLKGGSYVVQCTALDGRGGTATKTLNVTVQDPLLSWQQQASSLTSHYFYSVLFDGQKFVAIGSFVVATSVDGVTWTLGTGAALNYYNFSAALGGGRYVAVGSSTSAGTVGTIVTSTDGLTWTDQSAAVTVPMLESITYGGGRFVAVGDSGAIVTSTDGLKWTTCVNANTKTLNIVRYANGLYVAAGASGTYLSSTDGITWQDNSLSGENSSVYGLTYYQGSWLAITGSYPTADTAKRVAFTSANGTSWTKIYLPITASMEGPIIVANSSLVLGLSRAGGNRIAFATSPFSTWAETTVSATASSALYSAAEGNGTLVLVGVNGQIYTPAAAQPYIMTNPAAQTVAGGQGTTMTVEGWATGPFTYQWNRNGVAIPGATEQTYSVIGAKGTDAGTYTVTLSNATGSATSAGALLQVNLPTTISTAPRITNLSIRSTAGTGDQTLIVGLNVSGGDGALTKPLLVRAVGPTLADFGLSGVVSDPTLSVNILGDATVIASNDGWKSDPRINAVGDTVGAFPLGIGKADAAIYRAFGPESYTMQVGSKKGSGVALVEVYDATNETVFTSATHRLMNVSARTQVGVGDNVLIAGFGISGTGAKRLLVRAVGPELAKYGVGGTLADPKLEIYESKNGQSTFIDGNDNWVYSAAMATTFTNAGAFPLTAGSKDAALVIELQPGSYSAVVKGVGDTTGVALVEVYNLP